MEMNRPLTDQFANMQTTASNAINNVSGSVNSTLSNVSGSVNSTLSSFSTPDIGTTSTEFINSNSIISKFAFLLLVLILFIMLMNLGVFVIGYLIRPSKSPYIIKGIHPGNKIVRIPQDPENSNSVTIYRSNNEDKGIEFTWAVWINIDKLPDSGTKNIFTKGSGETQKGPSVGVKGEDNKTCSIIVNMDSVVLTETNKITISDIPLARWFNLAIRLQNKIMDVYVNGTVAKRYVFSSIPRQNYGDIVVGDFDGTISDLRYFDTALNVFQINNIAMAGPNMQSESKALDTRFDYLSSAWYSPS